MVHGSGNAREVWIAAQSKHLGVLKEAGIVDDDKRGLQVFYSLRVPCVLDLFKCIETVLEADARERMALLRNGGGATSKATDGEATR